MVESRFIGKNQCESKVETKNDAGIGHHQLCQSLADLDEDECVSTNVRVDTDHSKEVNPDEQG